MSEAMTLPPLAGAPEKRTPTVYFIDDSATMREVIKIAFRRESINVITCADAAAGDDVDALAAKGNLDDFAHGGAVVDEIDRGRALRGRIGQGRDGHCFAHSASLSAMSRVLSSNSRMASSMRSVALRSTVCCVELLP